MRILPTFIANSDSWWAMPILAFTCTMLPSNIFDKCTKTHVASETSNEDLAVMGSKWEIDAPGLQTIWSQFLPPPIVPILPWVNAWVLELAGTHLIEVVCHAVSTCQGSIRYRQPVYWLTCFGQALSSQLYKAALLAVLAFSQKISHPWYCKPLNLGQISCIMKCRKYHESGMGRCG